MVNRPATLRMLWAVLRDNPPQSTKGGCEIPFILLFGFYVVHVLFVCTLSSTYPSVLLLHD